LLWFSPTDLSIIAALTLACSPGCDVKSDVPESIYPLGRISDNGNETPGVARRLPRREIFGEHSPLATGFDQIADDIED